MHEDLVEDRFELQEGRCSNHLYLIIPVVLFMKIW